MVEPDIFFIVAYRDRQAHLEVFKNHMRVILKGINYRILISHQCDNQPFNRGAMKHLGFIWIKKNYPNNYKDKTLVFNDVDNMWWRKELIWETKPGMVKHFYGPNPKRCKALGGIFSITAGDFEKVGGFPPWWNWGYEDNALYVRCESKGIKVNYDQFHNMSDKNILLLWHGEARKMNEKDTFEKWEKEENNIKMGIIEDVIVKKQELLKVDERIYYLNNHGLIIKNSPAVGGYLKKPDALKGFGVDIIRERVIKKKRQQRNFFSMYKK